ncbi:MAG: KH domain-containing protein [Desulfobacterales bacterium]|nr:KH domain-containing protein [Desulfobacterales bacterium]
MSPYLEFEGKSVEKAIEKACKEQNIPSEKLKYDVISYGSTGIFGLVGAKKARIRVTLPEEKKILETIPEINDTEAKNNHHEKPAKESVKKPAKESEKKAAKESEKKAVKESEKKAAKESEKKAAKESEKKAAKESEKKAVKDKPALKDETETDKVQPLSPETLELGKNTLQRIIDFITTEATISIQENSDRVMFNIEGGNSAVLIGKRGQTLEAIQYLVEKVMNKHSEQRIRIQIDIEGYLDSRRTRLRSLATRLSEKAKRTGKPVTIGQLNAHDRRIIHLFLKDDGGVRTQSMGDGFYRKLVIYPKRGSRRGKYA